MNKRDLIKFEKEVIKEFKKGKTYGPVHLSGGNEKQLIKIFKKIKPNDWVFSTHRSHYHALLKSKNKKWLMNEIITNANSSHINSKKHKIFTSAIVGGIIPIALGTAMGIKLNWDNNIRYVDLNYQDNKKKILGKCMDIPHVWCFIGDMASEMGYFIEAYKYATGEKLPITFIVEDNSLGCNTPTSNVWKTRIKINNDIRIIYYKYKRVYPHYGIGEWVIMANEKLKTKGDYVAEKR